MTSQKLAWRDVLFLDDDDLIRESWAFSGERAGIRVHTFAEPGELYESLRHYRKNVTIYIDLALKNGVRGVDVARALFERGFQNLYIVTGYDPRNVEEGAPVRGIIHKTPPWEKGL